MKMKIDFKKFIARVLVAVMVISMTPSFGMEVKADEPVIIADDCSSVNIDGTFDVQITDYSVSIVNGNSYSFLDKNGTLYNNVKSIVVRGGANVRCDSYANLNYLDIGRNCSFSYTGDGYKVLNTIYNYGTLDLGSKNIPYGAIENDGTVLANTLTIDSKCSGTRSAVWSVSNSVDIQSNSVGGRIEVGNDTLVTIASGLTAGLYIGGSTTQTTFVGPVNNVKASDLINNSNVTYTTGNYGIEVTVTGGTATVKESSVIDKNGIEIVTGDISSLTVNGANVNVNSAGSISSLTITNNSEFTVGSGENLTVYGFVLNSSTFLNNGTLTNVSSNVTNGTFVNNGTISRDTGGFSTSGFTSFTNNGTVIAASIDIDAGNVVCGSNCKWQVEHQVNGSMFKATNYSSDQYLGIVIADSRSFIKLLNGGYIALQVGTQSKYVHGKADATAGVLIANTVYLGQVSDTIYYGVDYDFSSLVQHSTLEAGYDWELEYKADYDTISWGSTKPTDPDNYLVKAVVLDTTKSPNEIIVESEVRSYSIVFYPSTGITPTITGLLNTKYAKNSVTVTAPSGFTVADSNAPTTFVSSLTYTADSPAFTSDSYFIFKRTSDGATTDNISVETVAPVLIDVVYDSAPPIVSNTVKVNGKDVTFTDGMSISGNKAVIHVSDANLWKVEDGAGNVIADRTNGVTAVVGADANGSGYAADLTFETIPGNMKTFSIKVYDMSGNTTTRTFTLGDYLSPDGISFSITGLNNVFYAKDSITITPTTGYQFMTSANTSAYVSSATYSKKDLYDSNGKFNSGLTFKFKRTSDGAMTDFTGFEKVVPLLDDIIFDDKDPAIYGPVLVDGQGVNFKSGCTIEGYEVTITIADEYLEKVVVDKEVIDRTKGVKKNTTDYRTTLTFRVEPGETKEFKFTAYDMSGRTVEYKFTLVGPKLKPELSVKLMNQFAGVEYAPTIATDSDGAKKVEVYYATATKASVSENTFSETVPTEPGNYVVKVVVPETNKYLEGIVYGEFTISYLTAPKTAYSLEGTTGENEYYTTDVEINAPEGYLISSSLDGKYTASITYTNGLNAIYLMRKEDGALTGAIEFNEVLKIDTKAPAITGFAKNESGNSVNIYQVVFANTVTFTIEDEHLASVTVNGNPVTISNGKADIVLDANGHFYYTIVAKDEAGNEYSVKVEMKAIWMVDGVVPVGIMITLEPGVPGHLEEGQTYMVEGEDMIYYGGMDVYVSEEKAVTIVSAEQ